MLYHNQQTPLSIKIHNKNGVCRKPAHSVLIHRKIPLTGQCNQNSGSGFSAVNFQILQTATATNNRIKFHEKQPLSGLMFDFLI